LVGRCAQRPYNINPIFWLPVLRLRYVHLRGLRNGGSY